MKQDLLYWDVYEISAKTTALNGVMLRGRLRKLGIQKGFNILVENTEDVQGGVRFAVLNPENAQVIIEYMQKIATNTKVVLVVGHVPNPVLSKLKVNETARYSL